MITLITPATEHELVIWDVHFRDGNVPFTVWKMRPRPWQNLSIERDLSKLVSRPRFGDQDLIPTWYCMYK